MSSLRLISVVIPVYHNATSLRELHTLLCVALDRVAPGRNEVIYVDDGSADASYEVLSTIAAGDARVHVLKLSRNFGSTGAILAGLSHAQGKCAAMIAADLQDPPELVSRMYVKHLESYPVVLGERASREDPLLSRLLSGTFYALFRKFAIATMPPGGFDCFLLDRQLYRLLVDTARANTYLMGQILWLGFRQGVVPYERQKRPYGRSMWTFWKKVRYFVDSFVSFSYAPIRAATALGICLSIAGFLYALMVVFYRLAYGAPVEGWASLMMVVLVLGGTQLMVLGTLGEYLWRSLDASRGAPPFVVESVLMGAATPSTNGYARGFGLETSQRDRVGLRG